MTRREFWASVYNKALADLKARGVPDRERHQLAQQRADNATAEKFEEDDR